jgi:ubiquinone/menaquinone biosynthesis C-methylase UbiE
VICYSERLLGFAQRVVTKGLMPKKRKISIRKLIPRFIRQRLEGEYRWQLTKMLPSLSSSLMQFGNFYPHLPDSDSYTLPAFPKCSGVSAESTYPVPPSDLWVNYGTSAEEYLESGRQDVAKMREILAQSSNPIEGANRILELGCAAGRMIRWLDDLAVSREIWGLDIWASAIHWCKENLSPPFHFATTTASPHLPFEDRYFDCIYAGSVFTHIEDLTDAWFLELRRILRPGGQLYFSLNDRRAITVYEGQATAEELETHYKRVGGKANWTSFVDGYLRSAPGYQAFKRGDAVMVTIARSAASNVMWDAEFLCKQQEPFYRVLSITAKAYGHQTGVLLQRV